MKRTSVWPFCYLGIVLLVPLAFAAETKLTPEDLVAKHLASLGTPEARAAAASREFTGTAKFRTLVGVAVGDLQGPASLVSEGNKLKFAVTFNDKAYPRDQYVFDGSKAMVSYVAPGVRSAIGDFLNWNGALLSEGLFGGALSTAWPLHDLSARAAKLKYEGMKKCDAGPCHQLSYRPKKSSALDLQLFFDAATFRHVKSIYRIEVDRDIIADKNRAGTTENYRYELQETFGDFKQVAGLTLPTRHAIRFQSFSGKGSKDLLLEASYDKLNDVAFAPVP